MLRTPAPIQLTQDQLADLFVRFFYQAGIVFFDTPGRETFLLALFAFGKAVDMVKSPGQLRDLASRVAVRLELSEDAVGQMFMESAMLALPKAIAVHRDHAKNCQECSPPCGEQDPTVSTAERIIRDMEGL